MVPTLKPHVGKTRRQSVRVLLVDDDQEDSILIEHQLSKLRDFDIEFVWTNDVRDALQQTRTGEYDVLLIADEVISGFRMAPGGAQELAGVTPAQPWSVQVKADVSTSWLGACTPAGWRRERGSGTGMPPSTE